MMEDFNRLVELLLPTFLRNSRIVAMLRALMATPLQNRHTDFHLFREKTRYEAAITPQVCSLSDAVQRKFDVSCEITELDGKPYDFLVSIDRSTDLNAIRDFLNRFSLAGKTFLFALGDTVHTAEWSEYVDENLVERYTASWLDYVSEHDGNVLVRLHFWSEINLNTQKVTYHIDARSEMNVKVDVQITGVSYRKDALPFPNLWKGLDITILAGSDSAGMTFEVDPEDFERDIIVGKFQWADNDFYRYYYDIVYFKPGFILPPGGMPPVYAIMDGPYVPPEPPPTGG